MNLHRQIPVSSPGALVSSHVTRVRRISRGGWIRRGEKKYEPPSFRATWSITLPKPLLGLEKWSFVSAQSGDKMRQYDHCKDNRLLSVTVYTCNHTNGQRSFLLLSSHSGYFSWGNKVVHLPVSQFHPHPTVSDWNRPSFSPATLVGTVYYINSCIQSNPTFTKTCGLPITIIKAWALVIATLNLLGLLRKPML